MTTASTSLASIASRKAAKSSSPYLVGRHMRGALVEDLDRVAAALDAAFDGVGEAAGGGDVGAEQHGADDSPI